MDLASYDVAIVGYGPTGMTLAALLGACGHRVVVLERHQGLYNLPRAACFDDEIMRTFQKLGLVDEMKPGTVVQRDYEWVNADGQTLHHISYEDPAAGGWAALYMMYQPHLDMVLDARCRSLGNVEVRPGMTVDGLRSGKEVVILASTDRQGESTALQARYVVGADGGAGFVRAALGVDVSDYGFQENWLVCDFHKRDGFDDLPSFRQVCDPAQPISIVRIGPHHHRFSFMLDPDEPGTAATDPARVWQRVSGYLGPGDAELIRVANYVFRSRIAHRWRSGRVLLAGDAAHEMPPFLAQGMCSGIRDSHNLAWKLDLVLSGRAGSQILDTYQPEREPHVRFITERAIELGRVQTIRDPEAARARDERLRAQYLAHSEPERLRYPALSSGLIATAEGKAHAGEFFPQGRVRTADAEGLLDDVIGPGPCVVARAPEVLAGPSASQLEWWRALGGLTALVRETTVVRPRENPRATTVIVDVDGIYRGWFESHDCQAAVVRPDWYVYGTASSAADLSSVLAELQGALRPRG